MKSVYQELVDRVRDKARSEIQHEEDVGIFFALNGITDPGTVLVIDEYPEGIVEGRSSGGEQEGQGPL